jgi:CheY-like chemotaxis protein
MRRITGDLGLVGIANLLQLLSSSSAHGRLSIAAGEHEKVIGFGPDGIRLLRGVRRTNPLGEVLLRTRKISPAQLEEILAEQRVSKKRLGDLLEEKKILDRDALESALREQAAEEIYDLFTWSEAVFDFVETSELLDSGTLSPLASVVLDANVVSIMIEAARRLDELARIREVLPDFRLVVEQVEIPMALDDPGIDPMAVEDLLPLIDGERTVENLIESSLYPKFTVLCTIYALAQRGILKIRRKREGERPMTVVYRPRPAADPANKPGTLLLVSELVTFRSALSFHLRNGGYEVREASTWDPDAAATCRSCVNLILLDASIETDDGLALCQRVRESCGEIPFILLSGNRGKEAAANAVRSGARCVLVKPIQESVLLGRIESILRPGAPVQASDPV